jgi:glycosyltransferase involved in cell wall biosynthesis
MLFFCGCHCYSAYLTDINSILKSECLQMEHQLQAPKPQTLPAIFARILNRVLTHITFTVTNDLTYDQRMQRICGSLAANGFAVTLVGRRLASSLPFTNQAYRQKRLTCWARKGKLMYLEFNLRLFFYLLFTRTDCICAIDLDTILPAYFVSRLRNKKRVYDAHELFTEQKEIITRPSIHKLWLKIERFTVPKFPLGYTVNKFIVEELNRRYGVNYKVIRNLPRLLRVDPAPDKTNPFIIYQGAVNEGRSFETLIPAMKDVQARLVVCGNGNYFEQAKRLVKKHKLEQKVELKGYVQPNDLCNLTPKAYAAVMLFENTGLNQYYSLANRFFDYIMAGIPQVCVAYPEYEAINDKYGVTYLIYNTSPQTIAEAINHLLSDDVLYARLQHNALKAREELNWSTEEKVLVDFYRSLF